MASGEFALAPKPLSVMIQNVPSAIFLMPEWPCSGWPLKGRDTPVGRPADRPGTVPSASVRWPLVNLPLTCRSCGASLGAGIKDWAGITAWPAKVAGKAAGDCASVGRGEPSSTSIREERRPVRRFGKGRVVPPRSDKDMCHPGLKEDAWSPPGVTPR